MRDIDVTLLFASDCVILVPLLLMKSLRPLLAAQPDECVSLRPPSSVEQPVRRGAVRLKTLLTFRFCVTKRLRRRRRTLGAHMLSLTLMAQVPSISSDSGKEKKIAHQQTQGRGRAGDQLCIKPFQQNRKCGTTFHQISTLCWLSFLLCSHCRKKIFFKSDSFSSIPKRFKSTP